MFMQKKEALALLQAPDQGNTRTQTQLPAGLHHTHTIPYHTGNPIWYENQLQFKTSSRLLPVSS